MRSKDQLDNKRSVSFVWSSNHWPGTWCLTHKKKKKKKNIGRPLFTFGNNGDEKTDHL